jgi:hypothetical protein
MSCQRIAQRSELRSHLFVSSVVFCPILHMDCSQPRFKACDPIKLASKTSMPLIKVPIADWRGGKRVALWCSAFSAILSPDGLLGSGDGELAFERDASTDRDWEDGGRGWKILSYFRRRNLRTPILGFDKAGGEAILTGRRAL